MRTILVLLMFSLLGCGTDDRFAVPDPTIETKPVVINEERYDDSAILARCVATQRQKVSECIAQQHDARNKGVWCGWDHWGRVWGFCKN